MEGETIITALSLIGTLAVSGASHNIVSDITNMPDDADLICLEEGD